MFAVYRRACQRQPGLYQDADLSITVKRDRMGNSASCWQQVTWHFCTL